MKNLRELKLHSFVKIVLLNMIYRESIEKIYLMMMGSG
jgi:hypothetical protein